jgi:hypothetical protein
MDRERGGKPHSSFGFKRRGERPYQGCDEFEEKLDVFSI